ncbi:MAG: glycosyltransferase family 4 protein [Methanosphaera sp.]|nr:glycosyltransferase family 4 protein [Methanosphaera sp.]
MKFCIIIDFFVPNSYSSGQKRYFELAKRLVQHGHSVDILSMRHDDNSHSVIDGVNIYYLGPNILSKDPVNRTNRVKYAHAIYDWIRKHEYDIIDTQSSLSMIPVSFISKHSNTPVINTVYDTSFKEDRLSGIKKHLYLSNPYSQILTVTNSTMHVLVEDYDINDDRIINTPIGVDLKYIDSITSPSKKEHRIIYVGKLVEYKHVDHLVKIINDLKENIPDIHLVIVGRGIERESLENYIRDNRLEDYIEIFDDLSKDELFYQMKIANCLVLPSTHEMFGLVLTEAHACYTPTIAYDTPGARNIVKDNVNGFLVAPGDIESLEDKIEYLLENSDVCRQLGMQARMNVEDNYDIDKIVLKYINQASKLLNCTKHSIR